MVQPIPEGMPTLTPYLVVEGAEALIDFVKEAFGATEEGRLRRPDGSLMHAELVVGDTPLWLGEANQDFPPSPCNLYLRVEDCDAAFQKAVDAGATVVMEPMLMKHAGERYGGVMDPSGNVWWIATHVEDVPFDEQQKRIDAWAEEDDSPWR